MNLRFFPRVQAAWRQHTSQHSRYSHRWHDDPSQQICQSRYETKTLFVEPIDSVKICWCYFQGCRSGSRRAKITHKVHVLKCWMASFESWNRIGIQPRMLDPDPYQITNTDPIHWLFVVIKYLRDRLAVLSCLLDHFIFPGPSVQALAALREKARCVIMYAGMIPYRNVFTRHFLFWCDKY